MSGLNTVLSDGILDPSVDVFAGEGVGPDRLLEEVETATAPVLYLPSHGDPTPEPRIWGGTGGSFTTPETSQVKRDKLLSRLALGRTPVLGVILDACTTASDDWWAGANSPIDLAVLGGSGVKEPQESHGRPILRALATVLTDGRSMPTTAAQMHAMFDEVYRCAVSQVAHTTSILKDAYRTRFVPASNL